MAVETGALTPVAVCVSQDGGAPTALTLSAHTTARIRAVVWMANVYALMALLGMTVALSCVF